MNENFDSESKSLLQRLDKLEREIAELKRIIEDNGLWDFEEVEMEAKK